MNQRPTAYEAVALPLSYRGATGSSPRGLNYPIARPAPSGSATCRATASGASAAGSISGAVPVPDNADRALRRRSPPCERVEAAAGRAQRLPFGAAGRTGRRHSKGRAARRSPGRAIRAPLAALRPRFPPAAPSTGIAGARGRPAALPPQASDGGAPRPTAAPPAPPRRSRDGFRARRDCAPQDAAAMPRPPAARRRRAPRDRAGRVRDAARFARRARSPCRGAPAPAREQQAGMVAGDRREVGRQLRPGPPARRRGADRPRSAARLSSYSTTPRR